MKVYGVIMAGGGGTRFWPLSRNKKPKQLLNITGKELMINETIDRISSFIKMEDIFIITNSEQYDAMAEAVNGRIDSTHILREPMGRNTAPCIGYAAIEILKKYGDGVMCVFPADHYIKDEKTFAKTMEEAINVAENNDDLITVGIQPTYPATGYGYIRFDKNQETSYKKVIEFKEKPDYAVAKSYYESGEYVWNSGMFVWKASVIIQKYKELLPEIYDKLKLLEEAIGTEQENRAVDEIYPVIPAISVDYGIMEKADNVNVIPAEFGWNDVGSWDSLDCIYEKDEMGNLVLADEYINVSSSNCVIYGKNKLIATVNVDNVIVVDTEDSILICNKDNAQDVKKIVDELKAKNENKYL